MHKFLLLAGVFLVNIPENFILTVPENPPKNQGWLTSRNALVWTVLCHLKRKEKHNNRLHRLTFFLKENPDIEKYQRRSVHSVIYVAKLDGEPHSRGGGRMWRGGRGGNVWHKNAYSPPLLLQPLRPPVSLDGQISGSGAGSEEEEMVVSVPCVATSASNRLPLACPHKWASRTQLDNWKQWQCMVHKSPFPHTAWGVGGRSQGANARVS